MAGDNPKNESSDEVVIAKLGLKLPPLWRNNIKLWFVQAECNIELSGINADITKYSTVVEAN